MGFKIFEQFNYRDFVNSEGEKAFKDMDPSHLSMNFMVRKMKEMSV